MTTSTESISDQETGSLWLYLFGIIDRPVATFRSRAVVLDAVHLGGLARADETRPQPIAETPSDREDAPLLFDPRHDLELGGALVDHRDIDVDV